MRRAGIGILITAAAALALQLTACAPTVSMTPAPEATEIACADVVVRLPDVLGAEVKRETNAQGTAAWGNPTTVLLTCGVTDPVPVAARCVDVSGTGWTIDDSNPSYTLATTYGRTPAVAVVLDDSLRGGQDLLTDLNDAVAHLAIVKECR